MMVESRGDMPDIGLDRLAPLVLAEAQKQWKCSVINPEVVNVETIGATYEGQYEAGQRHGQGTSTNPDGRRYEGQWQAGLMHGQGTYTYPDGRRYEGQHEAGQRHGQGTYTYPDGRRY